MSFSEDLDNIVAENHNALLGKHESWERVRLGVVADVKNGFPFSSKQFSRETGVPLLRIRDVLSDRTEARYSGSFEEEYWVEPSDLIVGMDGDFNCARWRGPRALLNQRVCRIRSNDNHLAENFLAYALPGYLKAINDRTSSITVKHLSSKTVEDIPLPLPPRNEQRRIVAKIEALMARSARAKEALDAIPALLERYRQSVLAAAFRGDLTADWRAQHPDAETRSPFLGRFGTASKHPPPDAEQLRSTPDEWRWVYFGDLLVEGPTNGYSPQSGPEAEGTLSLKLTATTRGELDLSDAATKRLHETISADSKYWLVPGDLLIQRANTIEYVGASAIYDGPANKYVYPDLMMRVRIEKEAIRLWAWRYLNSSMGRAYLRQHATGTAGNMPKINGKTLRRLPVPLPPEREIAEAVRRIDRAFRAARIAAESMTQASAGLKAVNQSILAKAFRGELVPQDPNDEPASVLLARIKAERAATGTRNRRGGRRKRAAAPVA